MKIGMKILILSYKMDTHQSITYKNQPTLTQRKREKKVDSLLWRTDIEIKCQHLQWRRIKTTTHRKITHMISYFPRMTFHKFTLELY